MLHLLAGNTARRNLVGSRLKTWVNPSKPSVVTSNPQNRDVPKEACNPATLPGSESLKEQECNSFFSLVPIIYILLFSTNTTYYYLNYCKDMNFFFARIRQDSFILTM